MNRDRALELLHQHVKNPRTVAHCLASEAVLGAIAKHLGEDEEKWALAGLLHDLDVEYTQETPEKHGYETIRILHAEGIDQEILDAIIRHNEMNGSGERSSIFHHALAAGETITGLITATALVYPDKKVSSVKPKSIVKRMREKAFAASVNRETIMECEKIGIPVDQFAALSLEAMACISDDIGL